VREGRNEAAVTTIAGLSDFLRRVLEDSNRQEVSLSEEIEYLQKYLEIQKVRFAERLAVKVQVPSELLNMQVPSLILQPMVENAIKHGIAKRAQGGEIRVGAARCNGMLKLTVYNDGPSLVADRENVRWGIGISNTRTRLQSLYGESFELSLQNYGQHGVEAAVSVPFREK
jgi:two-component system, LytTR family, sensor kinase